MKILDIRREPKFNRGVVEIALDGEIFTFSFFYDDYTYHNNPINPSFYLQPGNVPSSVGSPPSQPTDEEKQKHFYETAKWEIATFLSTKVFKEWDVLKNLKK